MKRRDYEFQKIIEAAKNDYVRGNMSLAEVAEKYGISPSTLYRRSSKEGWVVIKTMISDRPDLEENEGVNHLENTAYSFEPDGDFRSAQLDCAKLAALIDKGIDSTEQLSKLRNIAEALTRKISEAVFDEYQFNRYVVNEKGFDENGKAITFSVEKLFDKLDTKALKEMTSSLKTLADCVRNLYGVPSFGESARLFLAAKDDDDDEDDDVTITFDDGEEFSL